MTVQYIGGNYYVCDIEVLANSFDYIKHKDAASLVYQDEWFERRLSCRKIPCDASPRWVDLANTVVVEGVDYFKQPGSISMVSLHDKPPTPQPEYVNWDDAYELYPHEKHIEHSFVLGWLRSEGYELVKYSN